jgi:hypothetical protein
MLLSALFLAFSLGLLQVLRPMPHSESVFQVRGVSFREIFFIILYLVALNQPHFILLVLRPVSSAYLLFDHILSFPD